MTSASTVSQSVLRLVRILEVFEQQRRPLSASAIAAALQAPRSSASALLRVLVDLSVLSLDRRAGTYFPTAHFARLGSWLSDAVVQDPAVLAAVKQVHEATSETVTLSTPTDLCVELVLVRRGVHAIAFNAEPGQRISLWGSAVGTAYLSTLPDASIRALYQRSARHKDVWSPQLGFEDIRSLVHACRDQGYATAYGTVAADAAAISVPLPANAGVRPLSLSVAGPIARIREREAVVGKLLATLARRLAASRDDRG